MTTTGIEPASRPQWLAARERGSPALIRLIVWITRRLGRGAGRALLPAIVAYFVAFSVAPRRASRAYLARVLGRRAGFADVYRHYSTFAATLLDRVYFLGGRYGHFDVRLHGAEAVERAMAGGAGCLLIGAHLGSFEVLRAAALAGPRWPVAMLMDNANARKMTQVFAAVNPALAADVINLGEPESLLRAKARLDGGALVGLLADRLRPGDRPIACPFLGGTMWLPEGPFALVAVLGAPVVLGFGLYRGGRRYDIHFELFRAPGALPRAGRDAAIAALARAYAARLEHYARLAPYNWFNFFDVWAAPEAGGRR
ncbi:MAG: acyl-CoA synthetase [Burkholderiales bacterium]|nr:acyl-CoA synthetase [Burkholderiales bacterium]